MKTCFRSLAALALLVSTAARLVAEDKPGETPYYPLKLGSSWTYKFLNSDQKLTTRVARYERVGDLPCAVLEVLSGGQVTDSEYVAVRPDGVYRVRVGSAEPIAPPFLLLKLPPKKGETWTINSKAGKIDIKGKVTIDDEKEVQVPAGKFKAWVVTCDLEMSGQRFAATYYFAGGVGMVKQAVKIQGIDMGFELEKYEEGK